MASLFKNIKENMSFNIDKGEIEIQKKIAKRKASSFFDAFTGEHSKENKEENKEKKKISEREDEYIKEHNKMFAGYDGSRRAGPIVSKNGIRDNELTKMKQNGKSIEVEDVHDQRYGSRMRVSGRGIQDMKAVREPSKNKKRQ